MPPKLEPEPPAEEATHSHVPILLFGHTSYLYGAGVFVEPFLNLDVAMEFLARCESSRIHSQLDRGVQGIDSALVSYDWKKQPTCSRRVGCTSTVPSDVVIVAVTVAATVVVRTAMEVAAG